MLCVKTGVNYNVRRLDHTTMTFGELSKSVYEDLNGNIVTVTSDGGTYRVIFECDDWHDNDRRRRDARRVRTHH